MKKKPAQKTGNRPRCLPAQDLASVHGGENGTIHVDATGSGGVAPNDNGVLHML